MLYRPAHKRKKKIPLGRLLLVVGATIGTYFLADEIPRTCGHYFTHACTSMEVPGTADLEDILNISGEFDEQRWLQTGESGIVIANRTGSPLWLYFGINGSLRDLIQHINPVVLNPGEEWELELLLVDPTELGLLGWANQHRTFSGTIEAQILNNYASYTVAEMKVSAERLYGCLVEAEDLAELGDIIRVDDIAEVIIHRNELSEDYDNLNSAYDDLLERFGDLMSNLGSTGNDEADPVSDTETPARDGETPPEPPPSDSPTGTNTDATPDEESTDVSSDPPLEGDTAVTPEPSAADQTETNVETAGDTGSVPEGTTNAGNDAQDDDNASGVTTTITP